MQIKKFIVIPLLVVMLASSCSLLPTVTVTVTPTPTVSPDIEKEIYKVNYYLQTNRCSKQQLLDKLVLESDLSVEDCRYVIDNCGVDWNEQAYQIMCDVKGHNPYSKQYLTDRLLRSKFTYDEIDYALNKGGFNWNGEALLKARSILNNGREISEIELRNSLEQALFTEENIKYALEKCGADWNEQARKAALQYTLSYPQYTRELMKEYLLEKHHFTNEQTDYGIANCDVDWNEQAYNIALAMIRSDNITSKEELINALIKLQFTQAEAEYAVNEYNTGINPGVTGIYIR